MLNKPIFILGAHKSGTSLLRNLLDGHPELFVIPVETHPFEMAKKWVSYPLRPTLPQKYNAENAKQNAINLISHLSVTRDKKGGGFVDESWNLKNFQYHLLNSDCNDLKSFIENYYYSIFYSITGSKNFNTKRFVEKSVTNAEFAVELSSYFPDAKFIHIVRNPYANIVSIRKYKTFDRFPSLKSGIQALINSHYFLYKNKDLIANYFILKYEDLVGDFKSKIDEIINFLEIKKTTALDEPTVGGKSWLGNSVFGESQTVGVFDDSLQNWKKHITHLEIDLVNKSLNHFLIDYNYEIIQPNKSLFQFIKNERPKEYIANRFYAKIL